MVICFECSHETRRALDALLGQGVYASYQDAIQSAIQNLFVLITEVRTRGVAILHPPGMPVPEGPTPEQEGVRRAPPSKSPSRREEPALASAPPSKGLVEPWGRIPSLFSHEGLSTPPATFAQVGQTAPGMSECPDLEGWLWGQLNRLLPGKASCRALAHLHQTHPDGIRLDEAADHIARSAMSLGGQLAEWDRRAQRARDDWLATAFPVLTGDQWKGLRRYANQFVGALSQAGEMTGLLAGLKLAGPVGADRISLTEPGWRFALLSSPVLDGGEPGSSVRLGPEEKALLLKHIVRWVPIEAWAYRAVLRAIRDGATTPEALDRELAQRHSRRALKSTFIATQRSGVISRMADLGLANRVREGTHVSYEATPQGWNFLHEREG
ncbi:hypothetical protein [Corallococcus sp. AB038B]|uniref:hypothetical protein n=1 Tax=Corallococcus sp. AB038B TaxID=2316718 RepID=UPI000EE7BB9F|nr:hypothetical protein [Corallococcus sp. AB038B]RKI05259.1 hypothetical protein D7Y04_10495 [Corallococcus sp. AB038B]